MILGVFHVKHGGSYRLSPSSRQLPITRGCRQVASICRRLTVGMSTRSWGAPNEEWPMVKPGAPSASTWAPHEEVRMPRHVLLEEAISAARFEWPEKAGHVGSLERASPARRRDSLVAGNAPRRTDDSLLACALRASHSSRSAPWAPRGHSGQGIAVGLPASGPRTRSTRWQFLSLGTEGASWTAERGHYWPAACEPTSQEDDALAPSA